MLVLNWLEKLIFDCKKSKLFWMLFLISFVKTGIWCIPNMEGYLLVPQNPFANLFPDVESHYLMWSWLGPFFAWLVGAKSLEAFYLLHLVFSLVFMFLAYRYFYRIQDDKVGRMAALAFTLIPASMTHIFWISSDSLTILLMFLIVILRNRMLWSLGLSVLLGMQHFEQGFCAFFVVLTSQTVSHFYAKKTLVPFRWILTVCAGLIGGKLLLKAIFVANAMVVASGRFDWMVKHIDLLLNQILYSWQTTIWSVLGVGWCLLFLSAHKFRDWVPVAIGFLAVLGLAPISGDQTRVMTLVAFPLYMLTMILDQENLKRIGTRAMTALFGVWLLVPWIWIWGGTPKDSIIMHDIMWILAKTGLVSLPPYANPVIMWPFQ